MITLRMLVHPTINNDNNKIVFQLESLSEPLLKAHTVRAIDFRAYKYGPMLPNGWHPVTNWKDVLRIYLYFQADLPDAIYQFINDNQLELNESLSELVKYFVKANLDLKEKILSEMGSDGWQISLFDN